MLRLLLPLLLLSLVQSATLLGEKKSAKGENDELHQELANKAVDQINAESNDLYRWELASVDDVHKQMVAGVKYTIQMSLVKTDCTKQASQLARTDCAQGNQIKKCTAEVVHKAWESSHSVNVIGCEEPTMRTRRHTSRRSIRVKRTFVMEELRNSHHVKPKDYVHWNQFSDFVDRHDRVYETKRVALKKFRIFKKNMKMARFYQEQEQGTAVYGVTQFSDMTSSEWKKTYLPYVWDQPVYPNRLMDESELIDSGDIPDSFDWRQHGAVTGVKNQGNCGSCWAFSTTGNVEGQWFLAKKKLVSLAEQQLVDCDSLDQGCNGGLPSNAYKEIIRMGGLEPEDKYPYDGKGETCHITRKEFAVFINGSVELPHNEESMKLFIAKKGPVSIGINANPLQFYRHGVSHPWKILCEPFMLNHGVLIVGYGTEKNKPYWIIKNSWGPTWGESGYYRLYRGKNVCGVREMATSAIVN